jgi:MOSC domain-containing protein YiiM
MRVVSVNVGLPRVVRWNGREVTTGIFKNPVEGRIPLRRLNLAGDRQADLSVHGGAAKAVYAYPLEHYSFWREELGGELPLGAFGENLTVDGLPLEQDIAVGDRFRIGSAELVVTQPRLPCYKLGLRFGRRDMVKRFLASSRTGYYLAVDAEGYVGAGDRVETLARHPASIPVAEITRGLTPPSSRSAAPPRRSPPR